VGESGVAEILGKRGLADAAGSSEQDVVALGDEVQGEKLLVELAVDVARVVPVELVERLEGAERGGLGAAGKVAYLALASFQGDQGFADLGGRVLVLGGVGDEREDGLRARRRAGRSRGADQRRLRWASS